MRTYRALRVEGLLLLLGLVVSWPSHAQTIDAAKPAAPNANWRSLPDAPSARYAGTLTYTDINGLPSLWYMGGQSETEFAVGDVDRFDIEANSWTPNVTTIPLPVHGHCSILIEQESKIYTIGGTGPAHEPGGVQVYDIMSDSWSTEYDPLPPALAGGVRYHGCGLLGEEMVVFGGFDQATGGPLRLTFLFDPHAPSGQQWTQSPHSMHHRRFAFGYATDPARNRIYAIGGEEDFFNEYPYVEVFDSNTGWADLPDLPEATPGPAVFLSPADSRKLLMTGGGIQNGSDSDTAYCRLSPCEWRDTDRPLNEPRTLPGYAGGGGHLYVVGGIDYNRGQFLASAEVSP